MTATATATALQTSCCGWYFFAGLGGAGSERLLDYVDQSGGFFEKGSLLACVRACVRAWDIEIITLRLCGDWKTNEVSEGVRE